MYKQFTQKFTKVNNIESCKSHLIAWCSNQQAQHFGNMSITLMQRKTCQSYYQYNRKLMLPQATPCFSPIHIDSKLLRSSDKKKRQNSVKNKKAVKSDEATKNELLKALFDSQDLPISEIETSFDKTVAAVEQNVAVAKKNNVRKMVDAKDYVDVNEAQIYDATKSSQIDFKTMDKKDYVDVIEDVNVQIWNATESSQNDFRINKKKRTRTKKKPNTLVNKQFEETDFRKLFKDAENDELETEDELKTEDSNDEESLSLQVTTKKIARKPPPNAERDRDMVNLLQEVVSELEMDQEDSRMAKRDLTHRFKLIQEQKAVTSTDDFESLLKEIKASSVDETADEFQWSSRSQSTLYNQDDSMTLKLDLNTNERLGIFNKNDFSEVQDLTTENSDSSTWSALDWYQHYRAKNDERISIDPAKYYAWDPYDELIKWTNEGKLWKFPVDNEAGMEEEASVPFYEHVFLEDKLNEGDWCPKTGPIRNFMSSVIVALSQNAYLTVKEKHEHIEWFRDYFIERLDTIKKLGLIQN